MGEMQLRTPPGRILGRVDRTYERAERPYEQTLRRSIEQSLHDRAR